MEFGKCLWAHHLPKISLGNTAHVKSPRSSICMMVAFGTETKQPQAAQVCLSNGPSLIKSALIKFMVEGEWVQCQKGPLFLSHYLAFVLPFLLNFVLFKLMSMIEKCQSHQQGRITAHLFFFLIFMNFWDKHRWLLFWLWNVLLPDDQNSP